MTIISCFRLVGTIIALSTLASFHFNIINGKIWIQQNNTDVLIADELVERSIAKSDIVLGFVPEKVRHYEGFAMA